MRKIFLTSLVIILTCYSYSQEIASFSSANSAACSGIIANDANITANGICRGPGIGQNGGGTYNSRNWTQTTSNDPNDYLEWSISPNLGFQIDLSSMDIRYDRSNSGPSFAEIQIDTGSGYSVIFTDNAVSTGSESNNIDLSGFSGITNTITFRLYAYSAGHINGTFDIEEHTPTDKGIIINGAVTPSCGSAVTWNGSAWLGGAPNLNRAVIIDGNYNTSINGNFSACNLVINSGNRLTVDNATYVVIDNDAVIDGELVVETQGNFVQNNVLAEFILNPSGIARVNKQTATKQAWYYYTYWSSPVESETINSVFPNTSSDRRFYFDAFNYLDEDGDNIDDNGDDWTIANGLMIPGVGYAATSSPLGVYPSTDIATFNGVFNTGDIQVTVANNPNNVNESWNLIGNPYSSAISFTDLYNANSTVIDGVAYLWSQASPPDEANPGNEKFNFSQNDYATYTVGSGGIAGGGPDIPNGYIPSGQSFFVAGLVNNGVVTFTNGIRKTDAGSNSQFFKSTNSKNISSLIDNKIWLNLTSDNGVFSQILVAYVEGATMQNDGLMFDAPRLITANKGTTLYSTIKRSNKKFAIQGRSPKDLNRGEKIKVGLQTFIETPTIYKFSIVKRQGYFLTNTNIFLRDNLLNKSHDLSQSDYSFASETGEFNDRFEIVFKDTEFRNLATVEKTEVNIIEDQGNRFTFSSTNDLALDEILIFDFSGNLIYKFKGNYSKETFELSKLNRSLYIAKIELSNGEIFTKKFIKK